MKKVTVIRDYFFHGQASLGSCTVHDGSTRLFKGVSLERGWVNNKNRVSCIPEGVYLLCLEYSPRFKKDLWEIYGVPNRRECKFHSANYWWQLNGCIALGKYETNLDGDPVMDVASSRITMKRFHEALEGDTEAILHVFNLMSLI